MITACTSNEFIDTLDENKTTLGQAKGLKDNLSEKNIVN